MSESDGSVADPFVGRTGLRWDYRVLHGRQVDVLSVLRSVLFYNHDDGSPICFRVELQR